MTTVTTMKRELMVVSTSSHNSNGGNRARIIQRYCWVGCPVVFQRQRKEPNAIGVYLVVPGLLFGKKLRGIGSADAKAAAWLGNMLDQDLTIINRS